MTRTAPSVATRRGASPSPPCPRSCAHRGNRTVTCGRFIPNHAQTAPTLASRGGVFSARGPCSAFSAHRISHSAQVQHPSAAPTSLARIVSRRLIIFRRSSAGGAPDRASPTPPPRASLSASICLAPGPARTLVVTGARRCTRVHLRPPSATLALAIISSTNPGVAMREATTTLAILGFTASAPQGRTAPTASRATALDGAWGTGGSTTRPGRSVPCAQAGTAPAVRGTPRPVNRWCPPAAPPAPTRTSLASTAQLRAPVCRTRPSMSKPAQPRSTAAASTTTRHPAAAHRAASTAMRV